MFIAEDPDQFKKLFVSKLKSMLSADEAGAFILVLANSRQDTFLKNELKDELKKNVLILKDKFDAGALMAAPDDKDVFQQLRDVSIDDIPLWQYRAAGHWQVTFNAMRKLRPARASKQVFSSITQPFDDTKFHFNKAFLKPEILWQGDYRGNQLRVLYNKFPFSDYHLLLVISPQNNISQQLTSELHATAFSMLHDGSRQFPGFGIGFNSLAAGASVNHLHFQGFIRERPLPIEYEHWQHNGGEHGYPLKVGCYADAESSWSFIEQLIAGNRAFNCIYRDGRCYVIARRFQGTLELPQWLAGAGWLDVAGVLTVSDEASFKRLDDNTIAAALALLNE